MSITMQLFKIIADPPSGTHKINFYFAGKRSSKAEHVSFEKYGQPETSSTTQEVLWITWQISTQKEALVVNL